MSDLAGKRDELLALVGSFESCLVAYSGGVDSAVAAAAAYRALGNQAVAATGVSPSMAEGELEAATAVAQAIGIRHVVIDTHEVSQPLYQRNSPDRCYHCKTELYSSLLPLARQFELRTIVNGANADDAGDYRPGMLAASEFEVRSPLLECGMTKQQVRELAQLWKLDVWDKPATPCLSSRIAYGEEVTPERLRMVDRSEQALRSLGFRTVRVRYHGGDLARIEVGPDEIARFSEPLVRTQISEKLRELGFRFITIDLDGFRSGSLNTLITLG